MSAAEMSFRPKDEALQESSSLGQLKARPRRTGGGYSIAYPKLDEKLKQRIEALEMDTHALNRRLELTK